MKTLFRQPLRQALPLLALGLITAASSVSCQTTGEPQISLFLNPGLEGWEFDHENDVDPSEVWRVEDGVLISRGTPNGVIRTPGDFGNGTLTLDWRWAPETEPTNSGLLLFSSTPREVGVWPKCLEVQLRHGNAGDFIFLGETIEVENMEERHEGRRVARTGPEDIEKTPGEWNKMVVIMNDGAVTVDINGQRVNEGTNASATSGAICLQSEGSEIHFRNITFTPLP